ncbi:MAG: M48 family metallopeptidase [Eubacteriales bacterium]|nr:M48 family metallopeptidase [Eubacteriales bacterium]
MNPSDTLREGRFPVSVTRKRMKNLYLRVLPPDGRVAVSAPLRTSDAEIHRFVESRTDWILKQRARILSAAPVRFENGGSVLYFGARLLLCVIPHAGRAKVERNGETVVLRIKPEAGEADYQKALNGWYRAELLRAAEAMLPGCERTVGKRASELKIRDMKTRWGTCNIKTAAITLNLRLAEKPPECLRYVLIHELCHLHEAGHNERFWRRMDVYCPDWKRIRKLLKAR